MFNNQKNAAENHTVLLHILKEQLQENEKEQRDPVLARDGLNTNVRNCFTHHNHGCSPLPHGGHAMACSPARQWERTQKQETRPIHIELVNKCNLKF